MAREATIIGKVKDAWGDRWDVREERETEHGFKVLLGWPAGQRGKGHGGPRVILTKRLVAHLERHRRNAFEEMQLPIASGTIKRLRKQLGHHRYIDAREWWEERIDDLSTLTLEQFAAKHDRKVSAVEAARLALVGKVIRDAGWWREANTVDLLLGDLPVAIVAEKLDLAVGSIRRLRWMARQS